MFLLIIINPGFNIGRNIRVLPSIRGGYLPSQYYYNNYYNLPSCRNFSYGSHNSWHYPNFYGLGYQGLFNYGLNYPRYAFPNYYSYNNNSYGLGYNNYGLGYNNYGLGFNNYYSPSIIDQVTSYLNFTPSFISNTPLITQQYAQNYNWGNSYAPFASTPIFEHYLQNQDYNWDLVQPSSGINRFSQMFDFDTNSAALRILNHRPLNNRVSLEPSVFLSA